MTKKPRMAAFPRPLGYYPTETGVTYSNGQEGMSLRDYFAAKIAAAIVGHSATSPYGAFSDNIAQRAYDVADAMLREREQ